MGKTSDGNFFEDFNLGMTIEHATPRTITQGDVAVYASLYGPRFAVQSSDEFARSIGYASAPVDDLLVFHFVLGKSVPDISLNAVANLGYAEGRFLRPVFPGDTIRATSEIIGLRQNSNGRSGVVYVRTRAFNQDGDPILEYARWVMVNKRDLDAPAPETVVPELGDHVPPQKLGGLVRCGAMDNYADRLAGSAYRWADYEVGEKIDHVDGVTLEEAEHQSATRLYQNTAKVHFNEHVQRQGRFGRRLVYGGVIISLARTLSFNGLGNAFHIVGINGGQHVAPAFAGDTVYAWSEVLARDDVPDRQDIGLLRVRAVAAKDNPCSTFPYKSADGRYDESVLLDFDYWVVLPK